jgi:hypothetical protein
MPSADEQLPEGTDAIITGASVDDDGGNETAPVISAVKSGGEDAKGVFFDRIDELRGQAGDKARDLAQAGKERATSAAIMPVAPPRASAIYRTRSATRMSMNCSTMRASW